QKQQGSSDCGVFAIATCNSLAYGVPLVLDQSKMRYHFSCFQNTFFTPFPKEFHNLIIKSQS
uniref:Ubiquitin-like protease family profile domain-containing protein n=1 Tax=Amphimedon queenslandica TaxID=400682 RepID=A0A1X7TVC4_AMPQE